MVYLDVYNTIFQYLEDIGIVDDVFDYAEEILDPLLKDVKNELFYNEFILEFSLSEYKQENKTLLMFLAENLYQDLSVKDKQQFDTILQSRRQNLKFIKKEKIDLLDRDGKGLFDFYFKEIVSNKMRVIRSSSPLEENKEVISARLIRNPLYPEKYSITGIIVSKETHDILVTLSIGKALERCLSEKKEHLEKMFEFSKTHTLEEIEKYKDKRSNPFLEQDREIMKINALFFEKFKQGFDEYLRDFFSLSNKSTFMEMTEYYLSIQEHLCETYFHTNYGSPSLLLHEKEAIAAFLAFLKKSPSSFEKSLKKLREEGKKEFERSLKNDSLRTRKKIMERTKHFLYSKPEFKEKAYEKEKQRLESYTTDQIKDFLEQTIKILSILPENKNVENALFLIMANGYLSETENLASLRDIQNDQDSLEYRPEEFYNYMYRWGEAYSLYIFLTVVDYLRKKEIKEAYKLLQEQEIAKTESFEWNFLIGRVYSLYDDEKYKVYFNAAKRVDKEMYRRELTRFLEDKEKGVVNLWENKEP